MANPLLGGRYQIIRQLGGGGFGQTFLAEDQHLPGRPFCVVKHLQPKASQPEALAASQRLFEAEATVLHELGHHSQIPRLTAHFQENNEFYLVQEFVQGTVLSLELKQRRVISEIEVFDFLLEVLTVLEFVHQHQVIHRDIKPANLIRRQVDGKIVMIDFGAVKQLVTPDWLPATPSLTVAVGSSGYSPPEQLAGKACFASDLYAVGMIAIQALTGIVPKQLGIDADSHEVKWRDRAHVTKALAEIIDRMIRYDFRQRYQSTSAVLTDLRTLNREVIQATQSDDTSFTWVERGDALFQQSSHRQALAAYDAAIQSNPLSATAWLKRGITLDTLQQYTAALTCYDRAVQLDADNATAWSKRGLVLENLGRMEEALASYRKVIELDGQNYWAWYDQGKVLEAIGQLEIALNAYQRALQIKPNFQLAIESRKRLLNDLQRLDDLIKLGHYDAALVVSDTLLKQNPDDGHAWMGQGIALARQQRFEAALTALDLAVELQPSQIAAWLERGRVLAALNHYVEAVSCYEAIIQQQGNYAPAWLARAQALEKLDQHEAAMLSYNQVMELEHSNQAASQGRERMLRKLQTHADGSRSDIEDDVTVLSWQDEPTALIADPKNPLSPANTSPAATEPTPPIDKINLAELNGITKRNSSGSQRQLSERILGKLQKHRQTVAAYNKAIQLNPNDPEVLQWRGNLLVALGRYEEAIGAYDRAIQALPENATLWCCLAGTLLKLKRHKESLECFDRAIKLKPENHTPWYWRGRVLVDLKQLPAAIEALERSLSLKPDFQPAKHDLQQLRQHQQKQATKPVAETTPNWLEEGADVPPVMIS
ncbi:tetratricopeptide repeat protein [filamentous cyanobacterium LEGE 11480]|uniref:Tetratricopeptide repeat protein n=1 Tax=Romeriopsis navalis LEGE 11480 TaxID=2777977 RepID=A0A928VRK2_9CYAN|nr:serine/threonine-protein kinase [Romeriopsis navalis]MBE9031252.1 tetratricopeptide repeat protein [Romeriopsis navalis LEGE 11480]